MKKKSYVVNKLRSDYITLIGNMFFSLNLALYIQLMFRSLLCVIHIL